MATGFASAAGILSASAIKSRDRNALPTFGSVKRRTSERKIRHLNSIYTLTYMSRLETQGLAFCGRMRSPSQNRLDQRKIWIALGCVILMSDFTHIHPIVKAVKFEQQHLTLVR